MRTIITPSMARSILEKNKVNRPINPSNIGFLMNEINKGNFLYNGEPIIISKCGMLIDGQHRLHACIETGINIEANIVDDVSIESMQTIDTGRNRTASDVFNINGIRNATQAAAVSLNCLNKFTTVKNLGNNSQAARKAGRIKFSNTDIINFYRFNSYFIDELINFSQRILNRGINIIPQSKIGGFIYLFSFDDFYAAVDFFRELVLGISVRESNVALLIRNKFINDKMNSAKLGEAMKRDLMIKGFNLYRNNESRKVISIKPDEVVSFTDDNVMQVKPSFDIEYLKKY